MLNKMEKGFTLIEAMITMLIVSVGLLAMGSLLFTGMKVNQNSELRMNASAMASSVMANLLAQTRTTPGYTQITANADAVTLLGAKYSANMVDGYNPVVTFVTTVGVTTQFTSITLTLSWKDHGKVKSVVMNSGGFQ